MSEPDANGWLPIETAPAGRCLMWVASGSYDGVHFGHVYIYPDERSYRPVGFNGDCPVTHWMPVPKPPVSPDPSPSTGDGQ